MRTYKFEKVRFFYKEIHGKICRKSPIYYKTINGVIYECYYDPEKPGKKTHKRQRCRDFMRWATAIAKLDYNSYPLERAKYEEEFATQEKYHQLFHYIVACHKLALERTLIARKPNRREVEWALTVTDGGDDGKDQGQRTEDRGVRSNNGGTRVRDGDCRAVLR